MQACSVSPPPPGALGADSLGLALEAGKADAVDVDAVAVSVLAVPPLDSMMAAGAGDSGAMLAGWGAGVPMADGGSAPEGIAVLGVVAEAAAAAAAADAWD
jgi:hypothetical protein